MAAFLVRALGLTASGVVHKFVDDDASVFERAISSGLAEGGDHSGLQPTS